MSKINSAIEQEAGRLKKQIGSEIAYFYTKYVPQDAEGSYYAAAKLPITDAERSLIDTSQGAYSAALGAKDKVSRYDVMEASIKDSIAKFYDTAGWQDAPIPDKFKQLLEKQKHAAMESTMTQVMKEVTNGIIRGDLPVTLISLAHALIDKKTVSLENLVESGYRQLGEYMLLLQYQEMGCERYVFITHDENCGACDALDGEIFAIDDAVPGENLPPMHTNCDCEIGILDGSGNVNAILTNRDPDETGEEDSAFLDKLQTVFDIAGLFPVFGEVFDGVNALIYLARGDYLNAALSGAAIIPLIGSAATAGKLTAKTVKAVDKVNDARKVVKEAAQGVGKYADDVAQGAGKAVDDVIEGAGKVAKRDELLNAVQNDKLKNAVNEIYRPGATTGDGGLADAVRHELSTGELVGGKSHILKATERVTNLENIINKQNLSQSDLNIAKSLLDDLRNALGGK